MLPGASRCDFHLEACGDTVPRSCLRVIQLAVFLPASLVIKAEDCNGRDPCSAAGFLYDPGQAASLSVNSSGRSLALPGLKDLGVINCCSGQGHRELCFPAGTSR